MAQHPADCALCVMKLSGNHVYVDSVTQARRVKAGQAANDRIRRAIEQVRSERT